MKVALGRSMFSFLQRKGKDLDRRGEEKIARKPEKTSAFKWAGYDQFHIGPCTMWVFALPWDVWSCEFTSGASAAGVGI